MILRGFCNRITKTTKNHIWLIIIFIKTDWLAIYDSEITIKTAERFHLQINPIFWDNNKPKLTNINTMCQNDNKTIVEPLSIFDTFGQAQAPGWEIWQRKNWQPVKKI